MFDSHRSSLVKHIGTLLVFWEIWGVVCLEVFPCFVPNCCSDPGIYFFCSGVFEVCGLSDVFEFCHFFSFFPDQLIISSLSA